MEFNIFMIHVLYELLRYVYLQLKPMAKSLSSIFAFWKRSVG